MSREWHLMRMEYRTDFNPEEPAVQARFSATIPDPILKEGQIVAVDWNREPGWVHVTFLLPGPGIVTR